MRHRRQAVSRLLSHVRAAYEKPASQWKLEKQQRKDRQEQLPNSDHHHMVAGMATNLSDWAQERSVAIMTDYTAALRVKRLYKPAVNPTHTPTNALNKISPPKKQR